MKRWPLHNPYFWETAPFFRILLPFAAGIWLYDVHPMNVLPAAVALFLLLAPAMLMNGGSAVLSVIRLILLNVFLFLAGMAVAGYNDAGNTPDDISHFAPDTNPFLVRISEEPADRTHTTKIPVSIIAMADGRSYKPVSGHAILYLNREQGASSLHKGDTILVPGNWQPVSDPGNPLEFDYARHCRRNNIKYRQLCQPGDLLLYATGRSGNGSLADRCHELCIKQLDTYLADIKTKGLIQAMLLGDEVNLDDELRQSYSDTGIVHIIAISGGNVTLFFLLISALLWWLKDKKHLWLKYALALPLVWFYVLMAGSSPSAVRAAIMFSLLAFSVMLQRNNNSLNTLLATAFLLLCAQPMWLFSIGFQLSFAAVLSLILFYTPIHKLLSPGNFVMRQIWTVLAASLAAEILVAPLVIYYFHTFPAMFLIANAAAYLFMGMVLLLGIVIIATSPLAVVAKATGSVTIWLVSVFDRIVTILQGLNPPSFKYLLLTGTTLAIIYFIIAGAASFLIHKSKRSLFIALTACCVFMAVQIADTWACLHQEKLIVFNTPQTTHIELIRGDHYSVLSSDTLSRRTRYATDPAHTHLRAWQQASDGKNELLTVHGKKILVLNTDIRSPDRFPIDYVIVNSPKYPDASILKKIFSPACVVMGNSFPVKRQLQFSEDCKQAGLCAHIVCRDGAFTAE